MSTASAATLVLDWTLAGDTARIRIPPRASGFADGLWRHTCFEAFVRVCDDSSYHELNFSPSGAWAAYAFDRPREGQARVGDACPRIVSACGSDCLELSASFDLERLSAHYRRAQLTLALSAVIEDTGGTLSYWALAHAPGKPDFHHPAAFALALPASSSMSRTVGSP